MSEYPEHDKLQAISDKSQTIGEFLDWARFEKGYGLGRHLDEDDDHYADFVPADYKLIELLAEFFEIDLDKIEAEKRAMLAQLREANRE